MFALHFNGTVKIFLRLDETSKRKGLTRRRSKLLDQRRRWRPSGVTRPTGRIFCMKTGLCCGGASLQLFLLETCLLLLNV